MVSVGWATFEYNVICIICIVCSNKIILKTQINTLLNFDAKYDLQNIYVNVCEKDDATILKLCN